VSEPAKLIVSPVQLPRSSDPRSPVDSASLRDELLNGEIFYSLKEAKVLIERWREQYNRGVLHCAAHAPAGASQ
jgi:hypothetical protein